MRRAVWIFTLTMTALAGCDKAPDRTAAPAPSAAPPPPPTTPPPPPPPPEARGPIITVDDHGATIDGTLLAGAPSEWQTRAEGLLSSRPHVAGEAVSVTATRDAKLPKVAAVVAALRAAKAKTVVVHTPTRDQRMGEAELTLHPAGAAECSAVAMIEHDGAVAVWTKGGMVAQRFNRGMAGPDLSASTDALRKRAAACDSRVWFASAADAVTWGLTFDLIERAKGGVDAGSSLKPTETVLLTRPPVAGRPVKEE